VILLFGTTIRILGVSPGFNQFHSDEGISYSAAVSMLRNSNLDPLRYDYPALVPEINWLSFRFLFTPYYWVKYYFHNLSAMLDGYVPVIPKPEDLNRIFQNDILGNREINALFWGRYTTAIISSASILLVYLLSSRLFNRQVGYLAAIFLAFNFRSVTNSHLGLPDTYNAFFLLFSLVASWGLQKVPTRARYIFAGVAVGLSLGTKYQVFAVFPFLVSHLSRYWDSNKKWAVITGFFDRKIYIAGCAALLTFIFLNPYLLINFDFATYSIREVSLKYAMGKNALSLFPVHYWIFNDYGVPLFLLIVLGMLAMLVKSFRQSLFLMSVVAPFLFVMMFYSNGGFYVRNFITITPLFLICAAWLVVTIYKLLARYSLVVARIATGVFLAYSLYFPVGNIITHTQEYQRPWNYQSIVESTRRVLPQNAVVVVTLLIHFH
jgi:4-amino-4-deoxy-L-arabinose transferase-like glycosyltransferase